MQLLKRWCHMITEAKIQHQTGSCILYTEIVRTKTYDEEEGGGGGGGQKFVKVHML